MWYQERTSNSRHCITPKFNVCCGNTKVLIPFLDNHSHFLNCVIHNNQYVDLKNYQDNIRVYNIMFAFTSFWIEIDTNFEGGRGPFVIIIQGNVCHCIGSMLLMPDQPSKVAQLYIYDTKNEVTNHMQGFK